MTARDRADRGRLAADRRERDQHAGEHQRGRRGRRGILGLDRAGLRIDRGDVRLHAKRSPPRAHELAGNAEQLNQLVDRFQVNASANVVRGDHGLRAGRPPGMDAHGCSKRSTPATSATSVEDAGKDDRCTFGKWLHGPGSFRDREPERWQHATRPPRALPPQRRQGPRARDLGPNKTGDRAPARGRGRQRPDAAGGRATSRSRRSRQIEELTEDERARRFRRRLDPDPYRGPPTPRRSSISDRPSRPVFRSFKGQELAADRRWRDRPFRFGKGSWAPVTAVPA